MHFLGREQGGEQFRHALGRIHQVFANEDVERPRAAREALLEARGQKRRDGGQVFRLHRGADEFRVRDFRRDRLLIAPIHRAHAGNGDLLVFVHIENGVAVRFVQARDQFRQNIDKHHFIPGFREQRADQSPADAARAIHHCGFHSNSASYSPQSGR